MHGRAGEGRKRSRHMWIGPTSGTVCVAGDGSSLSLLSSQRDCFSKDGRKISVGDCALFKPPQDSPPFIGIIRSLLPDKKNNSKVGVNWLYRPGEVKLGKGILLETAPNEIFYSFHKDEIPVASLLHPCKVAFLGKGVDLPSGICSFVCRRIYDITNKCLWSLTDQDFIDERQEEVDQLLHKTRVEMHATAQPGGPPPTPMNGLTSTSQLKLGSDTIQNSASSFASPVKGKKRERSDQGSESVKRERLSKADDGDHGSKYRAEGFLKLEISKIAEKRCLVDSEGVEKLVHLMRSEKKTDFAGRSILAGIIASTDKVDCLSRFMQLKGLSVLDEWLHDCDRGKINDNKDSEKCVEEFLLVLLRALDKLPVNLQALQMCNIGRSVNHLRSHKNMEIQKKARFLVDTWKKRVEAEMDAKSVSNPAAPWSASPRIPEISQVGNRSFSGTEGAIKSSVTQISASKPASIKFVQVDATPRSVSGSGSASASRGPTRSTQSPRCASNNTKDGQPRNATDIALITTLKEENSSSSSQSHINSQSCSSDHGKSAGFSGKEDAPSSTAGSKILNKTVGGSSRYRKSVNSFQGTLSGVQKEAGLNQNTNPAEKVSPTSLTCAKELDGGETEGNSQNLKVKIPDCGRSPAQSASEGSFEDPSGMNNRAPPVVPEKIDQCDPSFKDESDTYQGNATYNANNESWESNDFKSLQTGSDEGNLFREGYGSKKLAEVSMAASSSSASERKTTKLNNGACSSMNALVESCIDCSEVNASVPVAEDGGMDLLASVAAGVMSKSGSPADSPQRNNMAFDVSTTATCNESKFKLSAGDREVQDGTLCRELDGHSFSCNMEWKQTMEQLPENSGITKEKKTSASVAGLSLRSVKSTSNDEMATDCIRASKAEACSSLLPESEGSKLNIKLVAIDVLSSFPSSEIGKEFCVMEEEKNSLAISSECKSGKGGYDRVPVSRCTSGKDANIVDSLNQEKTNLEGETESHAYSCQKQGTEETKNSDSNLEHHSEDCVDSAVIDHKAEMVKNNVEGNDVSKQGAELRVNLKGSKLSNEAELCLSASADTSSLAAAGGINADAKVEFDLNEGVYTDEPKCGDSKCLASVHCSTSVPSTCYIPSSITVAAAAKGPFAPPEDLLRRKGELGWRGSAATSAFRPAEPRKVLGMPLALNNISPMAVQASSRPMLDFDLNVADERVLEDLACRTSSQGTASLADGGSFGGLDFDLNRVDEPIDMGNNFTSSIHRMDNAPPSVKALSNNFLKSEGSTNRNFDLNDGPAFEEVSAESSIFNYTRNYVPPVSGLRMHSAETGSITTWFTPSNPYPAVAIPPILPDREQPFPIIAPQRMVGLSNGDGTSFRPDAYKGAVLASSPAVPFSSNPYQYPVFPFGPNYPLPSATFSGSPTAHVVDSPSGGRIWIPAVHSQLLGGPVGSNYPRPYTVTIADGAESNMKWSRQGLDLNAGPLGLDTEVRDEISSRQMSGTSSQSLAEEQAQLYQVAGGGSARSQRVDGRATNIHGSRRN